MADNHTFFVDGEQPSFGIEKNRQAWRGYFEGFPHYKIFIDKAYVHPDAWYLVGHTKGSHVPANLETIPGSVIWRAVIENNLLVEWSIYNTSVENRTRFNLCPGA